MERKLQHELEVLKTEVLSMGAQVERNIRDAIAALTRGDRRLAEEVRRRDPLVDLQEIRIDEHCVSLLALQQPVAGDLRFITTTLKIVKDLERVGDMAKDIAERALLVMEHPPLRCPQLQSMGTAAQEMLKKALDSFVRRDVVLARQVIHDDDQVDKLYERAFAQLLELMVADSANIPQGSHLIQVIKYLERIGDHSSNIAEMVVFLVQGKDIRHEEKIRSLHSQEGETSG